jgi:DNA-binding transcriptional LysR family regulator
VSRDLNESLIFVKVAEKGSFVAAAKALGMPKTTVSRKLQDLEQRLGTVLLNRTTRKIALTEAGALYFEHCSRVARDLDEAEAAVIQLQGAPRGWLRVTAPYALALNALSPLLPEFMERYPDVRVELVISNDVLDLFSNEIDLALRVGALPDSGLAARRLATFNSCVYASPAYLERHGEPLVPADLENHRTVVGSHARRGPGRFVWSLRSASEAVEQTVAPVLVVNDPVVLRSAADAGLGICQLPEGFVLPYVALGRLRRVLAAWSGASVELNAVFQRGRAVTPKVRVFVDFLIERFNMERTLWGPQALDCCDAKFASDSRVATTEIA